jgi:hypothetical protein
MKPVPHFLRPRSAVVFDHTRRMLAATSMCRRKFAMHVAEAYVSLVAPEHRSVPFRLGVSDLELFKAERHNDQQIGRYMDGTVKVLPADLEDAWVLSLPEPFRNECERELAARRGRYAERRHENSEAGHVQGVGEIMVEFGQLMEALAPALADGQITEADLPHARRILNESDDLIAALLGIRRAVTNLLPAQGGGHG